MVNPQKFLKFLIFCLSIFCGFLLSLFIVQHLDPAAEALFHKTFSGRGAVFRISVSIIIFVICALLFFVLFHSLQRLLRKYIPRWREEWQAHPEQIQQLSLRLSVCFCILSFAAFLIIACFFRIICDDFDFLTKLQNLGMWGAIKNHYLTWSGRYMQYPMQFFLYHIPQRILFPLFSLCMLAAYCGSFYLFLRRFSQNWLNIPHNRTFCFYLATILSCGFLLITPSLFTSLYWYIGGVTFAFGIAAQLLSFAFLYRFLSDEKSSSWNLAAALLGTFLANGTNEMTAISMTIFSLCLAAFNPFYNELTSRQRKGVWGYFALSLICLIFMISAPGNFGRMSHAHHLAEEGLLNMFVKFFLNLFSGYWYFLKTVLERTGMLAAFCSMVFIMGTQIQVDSQSRRFLNWGAAVFFLTSFGCIATNSYLYNYLPLRSMAAPAILLVLSLSCLMLRLGSQLARDSKIVSSRILLCTVLCLACCAGWFCQYIGPVQTFAKECDFRDEQLRQADKTARQVETCQVNFFFGELQEVSYDPDFIINQQVAAYYGLNEIVSGGSCIHFMPEKSEKVK